MRTRTLIGIGVAGSLVAAAGLAVAATPDPRGGIRGDMRQIIDVLRDEHIRAGMPGRLAGLHGFFRGRIPSLQAFDADGDGVVTRDEVVAVRTDRLNAFDTDGDGALTLAEYEPLWNDAMREELVDRFQAHDDDGDGRVTVAEFNDEVGRGRSEEEAAELAAARTERHGAFDADGDGALTLAEYEPLWHDAMRPRMVDQFQAHDDDGDGIVTADEFTARWVGVFDRLDRDGNGVLDEDVSPRRDRDGSGDGDRP